MARLTGAGTTITYTLSTGGSKLFLWDCCFAEEARVGFEVFNQPFWS